ncbi:MAG: selenium cofactor biosynthesis protein YqeC [Bellilinea sp.]
MPIKLVEGLRADSKSRLAFVGAGGKTTAMFSLARQMSGLVFCLNTAHLAVEQAKLADHHVVVTEEEDLRRAFGDVTSGVLLFSGPANDRGRLEGLPLETAEKIKTLADFHNLPVLIEADGARLLALKAPAPHEPPIPPWVNQVVNMVGLSVLGKPLNSEYVFRPEIFSELSGAGMGTTIHADHLVRYLQNPLGGLKNIPAEARKTLFANQLDECVVPKSELIATLATLSPAFDCILAGSLQNLAAQIEWRGEPIAGIILAAGGAKRMGKVKQLLQWHGQPLVRHAAETAIQAGLTPVVVVTGAAASEVESALTGLPVTIVHNPYWETGQAGSVRGGVDALPKNCGGVVFLLSDMPQIPVDLIRTELELHQNETSAIICPRVKGQRGNPVLFDRQTFPALMQLKGDSGGRKLFDQFPIRWLEWDDPGILLDIDTPQDYQDLLKRS